MCPEDLEIENVDRAERLMIQKHSELPKGIISNIEKIRENLTVNEVGKQLLNRIGDVMYEVSLMEDLKSAEVAIKYLADTFWHQNY